MGLNEFARSTSGVFYRIALRCNTSSCCVTGNALISHSALQQQEMHLRSVQRHPGFIAAFTWRGAATACATPILNDTAEPSLDESGKS